jgi:hypothetical protein
MRTEIAFHPHMAVVDVSLRDRAQIFITGILIVLIPRQLPADLIIKMADFLLDLSHAASILS